MNQTRAPWTEATHAGGWCGNSACQQGGLGPSLSEDRGEATRLGCVRLVLLIPGTLSLKGPPEGITPAPPGMPAPSSLGSVPATMGSVLAEGVCEMAKFSRRKGYRETSFTSLIQIFWKIQTMLFLRFRFLFEKANIIIYLF